VIIEPTTIFYISDGKLVFFLIVGDDLKQLELH